jgi:hypothetical protein
MAKKPTTTDSTAQTLDLGSTGSDPTTTDTAGQVVPPPIPAVVEMASAFGFYDDQSVGHFWAEGQIVTDPTDIALLVAQNAPFRA